MNVEIMQWDLSLSDVVKFKSIISLAQLHGQLNPPPALPFTCVVLFGPTDKYVQSNNCNKKLLILGTTSTYQPVEYEIPIYQGVGIINATPITDGR
jgi:hypothetical protein